MSLAIELPGTRPRRELAFALWVSGSCVCLCVHLSVCLSWQVGQEDSRWLASYSTRLAFQVWAT